jgi:predicted CoA-binding protein
MIISDDPEQVRRVLQGSRRIVVVGCSPKPARDSHAVAKYLLEAGYDVVPVNPGCDAILGQKCYPDLPSVPGKPDLVDVFRKSEAVPPIAEQAVASGAECLWLQMGVVHEEAARRTSEAGLYVVMDRCIMVAHKMLLARFSR